MVALPGCERLRVVLYGAVRGVGFRPFVYRTAPEMGLSRRVRRSHERIQSGTNQSGTNQAGTNQAGINQAGTN